MIRENMTDQQKSKFLIWPDNFPIPEVIEGEHTTHINALPPANANTPWKVYITINNISGGLTLDALYDEEDGVTRRLKIITPPDPEGNRLHYAIIMMVLLWESWVDELF